MARAKACRSWNRRRRRRGEQPLSSEPCRLASMASVNPSKGAPRRALLVYSRVGGGHLSAARALAEAFDDIGAVRSHLVDAYVECGRFPLTHFPRLYARLARYHPRLWALLFHGTNHRFDPKRVLGPFLSERLRQCVVESRADVVVSVLPVINSMLAEV